MEKDERITIVMSIPVKITYFKSDDYDDWEEMKAAALREPHEFLMDNLDRDDFMVAMEAHKDKAGVRIEIIDASEK